MHLRPYQSEAVDRLIPESFRKGNRRIIRCAPTGSGKSVEMAEMIRRAYHRNRRVILLTHRIELFRSTLAHIDRIGIPCIELSAGASVPSGDYRVMLAMERTLWNRIDKIIRPDLVIADEIHFENFTKIIEYFSPDLSSLSQCFVIGFSATPIGKHIPKIYQDIISNTDIPNLIEQNYLVRCRPFQMQDEDGFDDISVRKGEFDPSQLFAHFNKSKLYDGVIREYIERCNGRKTIVFNVNIEHTERMTQSFRDAGIRSESVTSKTSQKDRMRILDEFHNGIFPVLNNCGILTTGYDEPSISAVIVNRATMSLPLWLQMQGRGSRPAPDKKDFIVLDFGMNHNRHGLWNQPREWTLEQKKRNKREGPAPVRLCPGCSAMLPASARICEFCGYEFPKPTHDLLNGVMVEVGTNTPIGTSGKRISELSVEQLADLQRSKKYKPTYIWRIVRSRGEADLTAFAKLMRYKNGWLWNQRKKMDDVSFRDYYIR